MSEQQINENQLIASIGEAEIENSNKKSQNYRFGNTNRKHVSKQLINENLLSASKT